MRNKQLGYSLMNLDSFYSFKNGANIPLVNGVCYFHLNPSLLPQKDQGMEQISKTLFSFPFSQPAHSVQNGI